MEKEKDFGTEVVEKIEEHVVEKVAKVIITGLLGFLITTLEAESTALTLVLLFL